MTPLVYSLCVRLVYHFLYLAAFIFSVLFFCFFYFFFFHIFLFFFFFFSSRRRHTRYIGDWSSDVCSSDLLDRPEVIREAVERFGSQCIVVAIDARREQSRPGEPARWGVYSHGGRRSAGRDAVEWAREAEIGRASGRGRGGVWGVAGGGRKV